MPRKLYPGQLLPRLTRDSLPPGFVYVLVAQSHPAHPAQSRLSAPYRSLQPGIFLASCGAVLGAAAVVLAVL